MDAAPSRRHSVTITSRRLTPVALLFLLRVPFMVKPLQARIHHKYNVKMLNQTLVKMRMVIPHNTLIGAGVVLLLAFLLLPVAAQQRQTLSRLEFVGLKRLTRDVSSLDTQPSWSPDGKEIAFESDVFMLPGQIFAMRPDGTRRHQLTDPELGASSRPSWSSDGKLIVFMSSRDHHTDVWVMNADGSHQLQLTRNHGFAGFPGAG